MKAAILLLLYKILLAIDHFADTKLQTWLEAIEKKLPEIEKPEL